MKILIDICHPAHVHFFKHALPLLKAMGHELIITSRFKDCTQSLLDAYNIQHIPLSTPKVKGPFEFLSELFYRNIALYQVVKKTKPDLLTGVGGPFIAQVGKFSHTPSIVFQDSDNVPLQNIITYSLASCVITPNCYHGWLPKNRHIQYEGYHELAYCHPNYFTPDKQIALQNGVSDIWPTYFIRALAWVGIHDRRNQNLTLNILENCVTSLSKKGKVLIRSEKPLPDFFTPYLYAGKAEALHHVLAHCSAFMGDSPTMAMESAIFGVPALYVSSIVSGHILNIHSKYNLIVPVQQINWDVISLALDKLLSTPKDYWDTQCNNLLKDTKDMPSWIVGSLTTFPKSLEDYNLSQTKKQDV